MKIGIADIESSQYGMASRHMEALSKSAAEIGPIGIRPVSRFAKTYIDEGHPTKPFAIKNKSANSGPAAGLIPINPLFGRPPALSDVEKALPLEEQKIISNEKYAKQIQDAYQADAYKDQAVELKEIDLKISPAHLQELQKLDSSMQIEPSSDSNYQYKITWGDKAKDLQAYAKLEKNGNYAIFDKDNNPLKVLGRTTPAGIEKGITADYDILVVCPSYASFDPGGIDKTPFPTQGLSDAAVEKNKRAVRRSTNPLTADSNGPRESASGGNWSERTKSTVELINKNISTIDPVRDFPVMKTTHHNSEFTNPFADDLNNSLPSLFFLPKEIDLSAILKSIEPEAGASEIAKAAHATHVLIETPNEMNMLRNVLRDQGYYWPAHARYAETIEPFRPGVKEIMNAAKDAGASNSTLLILQQIKTKPSKLGLKKFKQEEDTTVDAVRLQNVNMAVFSKTAEAKLTDTSSSKLSIKPN